MIWLVVWTALASAMLLMRAPDSFRLKDASGRVIGGYPVEDGLND
jgi:hypothetical protein